MISGLRRFFRHERSDIGLEIAFHIETRADDLARLGIDRAQAYQQALAEFGDVKRYQNETARIDRERAREVRMKELVQSVASDLAFAARTLRRAPGFTVVAVLTLALGVGATVAVFSAVSGAILRPLPFSNAARIVHVGEREAGQPGMGSTTSADNAYDWQRMSTSFSAFGLYRTFSMTLTGAGEPTRIDVAEVTPGMFEVFGVRPALGRGIVHADTGVGVLTVANAVVSHDFWRARLGADPNAIGREIQMNFNPVRIVGVLPAGFHGPQRLDRPIWINFVNDTTEGRSARSKNVFALLKPGVTRQQAQAEMTAIARQLEERYPRFNKDMTVAVDDASRLVYGDVQRPLFLLLGASLLVLLIACANISNLLVARGVARGREVAVRVALGAARSRIARQMLTESFVLATLGSLLGVGIAFAAVKTIGAVGPEVFETRPPVVDGRVLAAALALTLVSTFLFGLLPALRSTRPQLYQTLRQSGGVAGGGSRTRGLLALAQFALAVMLLSSSALVLKSFARVMNVEPGVRTENVLYGDVWLPRARYDSGRSTAFYEQLEQRLLATPGVRGVGFASQVPLSGNFDRIGISRISGLPELSGSAAPEGDRYIVNPGYFKTMGVRLLAGRLLSPEDRFESTPVAVVDSVFAKRLATTAGRDVIGLTMKLPAREDMATIVGVVSHVKTYGLDVTSPGQIYMSNAQYRWRWLSVLVKTAGDAASFAPTLGRVVREVDADQPVSNVTTIDRALDRLLRQRRFTVTLLAAFASVAIVLAAIGLYGVIAYGVTQRRRELGVRIALGAPAQAIGRMVVAEGGRIALVGTIIGGVAALASGRVLSTLLFEVEPTDPIVFIGVGLSLIGVAVLACLVPARRAMRVDAAEVLRGD
jgi:putative ABC transport system permease protein